jgi:hypothetical protein
MTDEYTTLPNHLQPRDGMDKLNHYIARTIEHIHRVQKNMVYLTTNCRAKLELNREDCRQLLFNVMKHDQSKFSVEQFEPYIELTEYYFQRKNLKNLAYEYPEGVKKKVDEAVIHHYKNENHHPEIFEGTIGKWSKLEAIETVCDLQAMAQEFNEGTCRSYFENVWKMKESKYFYDDFNWVEVTAWMDAAIKCFERHEALNKIGAE